MSHQQELARQRATIIMQVRSGTLTVTEGARRLGISRKTYYQWEGRGLEGMLKALENQDPGRPVPSVDTEKQELATRIRELEQQLLTANQRVALKQSQLEYERQQRMLERETEQQVKKNKT
jgi:transposase